MRSLKKIIKEQYYISAPDQLKEIKEKVDLNSSKTSIYDALKAKNFLWKLSTICSTFIILFLGLVVIQNHLAKNNFVEELDSKQDLVNSIFRDKVKENHIENIELTGRLLPLDDEEIVHFVSVFSQLEFKKSHEGPDVYGRDSLEFVITFKDDSSISITFYENNYIKLEISDSDYYFYEPNSYNKIK